MLLPTIQLDLAGVYVSCCTMDKFIYSSKCGQVEAATTWRYIGMSLVRMAARIGVAMASYLCTWAQLYDDATMASYLYIWLVWQWRVTCLPMPNFTKALQWQVTCTLGCLNRCYNGALPVHLSSTLLRCYNWQSFLCLIGSLTIVGSGGWLLSRISCDCK